MVSLCLTVEVLPFLLDSNSSQRERGFHPTRDAQYRKHVTATATLAGLGRMGSACNDNNNNNVSVCLDETELLCVAPSDLGTLSSVTHPFLKPGSERFAHSYRSGGYTTNSYRRNKIGPKVAR